MDRLKGLFATKLPGFGNERSRSFLKLTDICYISPSTDQPEIDTKILESLPHTKQYLENSPFDVVKTQAETNNGKAEEAVQLLKRVDNLIISHKATAQEFKESISQLSTMKTEINRAVELAYSLQQQLLELQREVAETEDLMVHSEVEQLRKAEEERFDVYAKSKRNELSRKEAEYAQQIQQFVKDRTSTAASQTSGLAPRFGSYRRPKTLSVGKSTATSIESLTIEDKIDIKDEELAKPNQSLDDFYGEPLANSKTKDFAYESNKRPSLSERGRQTSSQSKTRPQILSDEDFDDNEDSM